MANEISNISHAGLVCQLRANPDPPILLASWGLDTRAGITRQTALNPGIYSIPLSRPIGAVTGAAAGEFVSTEGLVLWSGIAAANFLQASLVGDDLQPLPLNSKVQLSQLLLAIINTVGTPFDVAVPIFNVEVRRLPQD